MLGGRRKGIRNLPDPALGPDDRAALERAVAESLRIGLGIRAGVELTTPGELPRWDHKARRVKDERTEVPF